MHHFMEEMCTHVHISVTKWCNYRIWDRCIVGFVRPIQLFIWVGWTWARWHSLNSCDISSIWHMGICWYNIKCCCCEFVNITGTRVPSPQNQSYCLAVECSFCVVWTLHSSTLCSCAKGKRHLFPTHWTTSYNFHSLWLSDVMWC